MIAADVWKKTGRRIALRLEHNKERESSVERKRRRGCVLFFSSSYYVYAMIYMQGRRDLE